jgi:hypothetical protein
MPARQSANIDQFKGETCKPSLEEAMSERFFGSYVPATRDIANKTLTVDGPK